MELNGDGSGDDAANATYFAAILNSYETDGLKIAFWRSKSDGTPSNGGTAKPVAVGDCLEIEGPLRLCCKNALHATLKPQKWKGARWWVVGLHEPVIGDDEKYGSLKRTILADLGKCPFPET